MKIIRPEQWYKLNYRYPAFYNDSDEIVTVRQTQKEEIRTILIALPGHVIQLIEDQAYFTRITPGGVLEQFLIYRDGTEMLRNTEHFCPETFLRVLRQEMKELEMGAS